MYRPKILIADDEEGVRFFLRELLSKENYEIGEARDGKDALLKMRSADFDLVILDVKMPRLDGISALREMRKINPNIIAVMITAYGSQKIAQDAIREGAYDYFTKPFDAEELKTVIRRALEKKRLLDKLNKLQAQLSREHQLDRLIGSSDGMQEVYNLIRKVVTTDVNILICGESGTGKELVAQAIHYNSHRRDKPFVKVSCVAIPESLLESELFGHEKGAFTGAYQQKLGKFEMAESGTLFLDEIGDMPPSLQAKILRVLQEHEFERVGGNKTIKVDIRIVAATNIDLLKAVEAKEFREDLYFRINVLPIYLPPLRERISDIPLLVDHFVSYYNKKLAKNISGISDEVQAIFLNYPWPGNVREMENVLQRAMILSTSNTITKDCLPVNLRSVQKPAAGININDDFTVPLAEKIQHISDQVEKRLIESALRKSNFKRQKTAELLGISRKSLHNKMRRHNLFEKER